MWSHTQEEIKMVSLAAQRKSLMDNSLPCHDTIDRLHAGGCLVQFAPPNATFFLAAAYCLARNLLFNLIILANAGPRARLDTGKRRWQ